MMTGVGAAWSRWVVLAMFFGAAGACSSSFDDCVDSKTCAPDASGEGGEGNGGEAAGSGTANSPSDGGEASSSGGASAGGGTSTDGGAGQGGEGGLPPLPENCSNDVDCDDGLHCTGVEQCVNDECEYGPPPCFNDEPDHCAITCSEGASGPECGLKGADADGDEHGDPECSQNPGDDCNDSASDGATIYPGAPELCNADVDDDCDGTPESGDEEVALGGTTQVLAGPSGTTRRDQVTIAANPAGGFGVAWTDWRDAGDGVTSKLFFRPVAGDAQAGSELELTWPASQFEQYYDTRLPDIAWSADASAFRVAFRMNIVDMAANRVSTIDVEGDGSAWKDVTTVASSYAASGPQIDEAGSVCWYADNEVACVGRDDLTDADLPNNVGGIALVDGVLFVAFEDSPWNVERWDGTYSAEWSTKALSPAVFATTSARGLATVFREDAATDVIRLRTEGTSAALPDGIPADVAATSAGWAVLYWNTEQTALHIRSVRAGASASSALTLSGHALVVKEEGTSIGSAALAVDKNDNVAVVWSSKDTSTNEWSILYRVFSSKLCE